MTPARLGLLILVAVTLWSGYWFVGARAKAAAVRAWLADQAAAGLIAEGEVATRGFPMRFDTTITGLRLGDPDGLIWEADAFQLLMLAYVPNRAVAAFPGPQRLVTPLGTVTAEGARATASAEVGVAAGLPLTEVTGIARDVAVTGAGWTAALAEMRAALRAGEGLDGADAPPEAHRIGLALSDLALPPALFAAAPALAGVLPPEVAAARLDALAVLDAPLALSAETPARLAAVEVGALALDWGAVGVRGGPGRVEVGADGRLFGRLDLSVTGLDAFLDALAAAGVLPAAQVPLARASLAVLSGGGPDAAVDLPLVIEAGRIRLGPLPLGEAPVLPPPR